MTSLTLALYRLVTRHAPGLGDLILSRRLRRGKEVPEHVEERRGFASAMRPRGDLIWIHLSGLSDYASMRSLSERLLEEDPALHFLVSIGSSGQRGALERHLAENSILQLAPIDFSRFVRRFLDHWRPDLAIFSAGDIWPTTLAEARARGVPLFLLNARMSRRSFGRWRYVPRAAAHLVAAFDTIQCQDRQTADFLSKLGADASRFGEIGQIGEGAPALPHNEDERAELASALGRRSTWLAASVGKGEEVIAADAHREVLRRAPRALLIVVPNDPEEGPRIAGEYCAQGWRTALRSIDEPLRPDTEIYIADTAGELGLWYRLCPISFMGGSLVGGGASDPMAPAALGSAILHGPLVAEYRDDYERLAAHGASRLVREPDQLAREVISLLAPDQVARMAHAAWEVCSSSANVTDWAAELILRRLEGTE